MFRLQLAYKDVEIAPSPTHTSTWWGSDNSQVLDRLPRLCHHWWKQ